MHMGMKMSKKVTLYMPLIYRDFVSTSVIIYCENYAIQFQALRKAATSINEGLAARMKHRKSLTAAPWSCTVTQSSICLRQLHQGLRTFVQITTGPGEGIQQNTIQF